MRSAVLVLRSARAVEAPRIGAGARASRRMRTAIHPSCPHASRRRLLMVRCPPSPFETLASLVPQDEGGPRTTPPPRHEGITIARAGRRAKPELWLFPVFVLLRPVIGGYSPRHQ